MVGGAEQACEGMRLTAPLPSGFRTAPAVFARSTSRAPTQAARRQDPPNTGMVASHRHLHFREGPELPDRPVPQQHPAEIIELLVDRPELV